MLILVKQEEDYQIDDEEDDAGGSAMKAARRSDQYTLCIKFGLAGIASRFGLTAEQVRINWFNKEFMGDVSNGLLVRVLAFYYDDLSSYPAEVSIFPEKILRK